MSESGPIRIGVIGAAAIVPAALTKPARIVPEVQVAAIAARDPQRAEKFARKHRIPKVHKTYDDLLVNPDLDAIYNPLPNSLHAEWTIRALQAGKHVLCEKPFASNASEAQEMATAAEKTGRILSEGFAYRNHPLFDRMKAAITTGELGKIKKVEARFCFLLPSPSDIRFRYDLAGGALMDAGCYPVSLIRYLLEMEPQVISANAKLYKSEVDSRMEADLQFPNGIEAHIVCDMLSPRLFDSMILIQGNAGEMKVINPYHPHWFHRMTLRTAKGAWRGSVKGDDVYALQLRAFAQAIRTNTQPVTNAEHGIKTMQVIDAIYKQANLKLRRSS